MTEGAPPAAKESSEEVFARARVYHEAGRFADAEKFYRELLETSPGHPDVSHLLGVLCSQTGRHDEAMGLIRQAIQRMPRDAGYHHDLGNVFMQLNRWEDAVPCFRQALTMERGYAEAAFSLGLALILLGDAAKALEAFRHAIAASPHHINAMVELAACLAREGEFAEAIAVQEQAVGLQPDNTDIRSSLGIFLMGRHDWDQAIAAFDAALGLEIWHVAALAGKGIALFEAGREREAGRLMNFQGFITTDELTLPAELDRHRLARALAAQPGNLSEADDPPTLDFVAALTARLALYVKSRVADPDHPFLARIPTRWTCNIRVISLLADGSRTPDPRPAGWLSGMYFPEVPDQVPAVADTGQAGWMEFGTPGTGAAGFGIEPVRQPPMRRIRPQPGGIILFPSYFPHRTLPLDVAAPRIAVAFELLPVVWRDKFRV